MMKDVLGRLIRIGVTEDTSLSERRTIVLSNVIATVLIGIEVILFLFLPGNHTLFAATELLVLGIAFVILLNLNKVGYYTIARLYLSWFAPLYLLYFMIKQVAGIPNISSSFFDGFRYYLLAGSCLPFLLFGKRNLINLIIAAFPGLVLILFCEQILNVLVVGFSDIEILNPADESMLLRSTVSYVIIVSCCFGLRWLVDKNDELNEALMQQLTEKNIELKATSDKKLIEAKNELKESVHVLNQREFILKLSQKTANIGSWEYSVDGGTTIYSDELCSIFGVEKSEGKECELEEFLVGFDKEVFNEANKNLLKTGEPYDIIVKAQTPLNYTKWIRLCGFPVEKDEEFTGIRGVCHDVTYFKEAEELVKEREHQYKSLFENAFDPIILVDEDGKILDTNNSFLKLMRYEKVEVIQQNVNSLLHPDHQTKATIKFDFLKEGDHVSSEIKMINKDGAAIDIEASFKNLGDQRIMVIIRDVTEIRQIQQVIADSEAKFRAAFSYSAVGMAIVTLNSAFLKTNEKFCTLLGYSEEDLKQLSVDNLIFPEDLEKDQNQFKDIIQGKITAYSIEKRLIHKDRTPIWVNMAVSLVKDSTGSPNYFVIQFENIHQRKIAELKLKEEEEKFRTLVERSLVGIFIVQDGKLLYINPTLAKIGGFKREDNALGISALQNILEDDKTQIERDIDALIRGETESIISEFRLIKQDGRIAFVNAYGNRINYEGRPAVIGSVVDNTDKRLHELEMREANKKIGELKLMALRSVMNPHFIFNVLNSIQYFITENDRLNAINYLSTFSQLIRSVLNHSVNNKISLSEEISLLRNYIDLERIRFENKFDYKINVGPNLEMDGIDIPSLLIQPYVENAILHGLYNKKEKGNLAIDIYEEEEKLFFKIEDDGIGRKAAAKLNLRKLAKHKSMGIKITEERLRLVNENEKVTCSIEDLKDENGSSGTRVLIGIDA